MERPDFPVTAEWVAERLLEQLGAEVPREDWQTEESDDLWMLGVDDRWIAWIAPNGTRVGVTILGCGQRRDEKLIFPVAKAEDIDGMFAEFRGLAAWWVERLTAYRLQPGGAYGVIREFRSRRVTFLPDRELVAMRRWCWRVPTRFVTDFDRYFRRELKRRAGGFSRWMLVIARLRRVVRPGGLTHWA